MRFRLLARRIVVLPALGLALGAVLAACSSSSSSSAAAPTSSPASSPSSSASAPASASTGTSGAAAAQVKADWETFFNGSTPVAKRVALLQNGQAFAAVISAQAGSSLAKSVSAKVTSVTVNSPTSATVKYDIVAGSSTLLPNQTGQAVYQGGTWKVGDASFCGLLKLQGTAPSACSSS